MPPSPAFKLLPKCVGRIIISRVESKNPEQSNCYIMSETYGFPPVNCQNVCTENWSLTEREVLLYIRQMEKKISGVHAE